MMLPPSSEQQRTILHDHGCYRATPWIAVLVDESHQEVNVLTGWNTVLDWQPDHFMSCPMGAVPGAVQHIKAVTAYSSGKAELPADFEDKIPGLRQPSELCMAHPACESCRPGLAWLQRDAGLRYHPCNTTASQRSCPRECGLNNPVPGHHPAGLVR